MKIIWRRYEVLLPVNFNDGRAVPEEWLAEAAMEVRERFGAVSYESQCIEGQWQREGMFYRDELSRITVDMPDKAINRQWMKKFKARWKSRLVQLDLWMVSYRIEIE